MCYTPRYIAIYARYPAIHRTAHWADPCNHLGPPQPHNPTAPIVPIAPQPHNPTASGGAVSGPIPGFNKCIIIGAG